MCPHAESRVTAAGLKMSRDGSLLTTKDFGMGLGRHGIVYHPGGICGAGPGMRIDQFLS